MSTSGETTSRARAAGAWADVDLTGLLTETALSIGAGTPTDVGRSWTLPTQHPDPIVLAAGIPDAATLPVDDLREAFDHVLHTQSESALEYGGRQGFDGLREALARRQSKLEGVPLEIDNLLLTNGSSGAIDNICRAFIEPGDVVITERPSYSGSVRTMRGYGAEIVDVPMDSEGISLDGVAGAIATTETAGQHVKFLYTIADFHNPTGTSMSDQRRGDLVELCSEHHVIILEDSAYAELYFGDQAQPSMYSVAGGEGVLRLGSFSKSMATGLRVGWVQGRSDFVEAISYVRFDMGNSPLLHRSLAGYVSSGKLDEHLKKMRLIYAEKSKVLANSLAEHCEPYLRFNEPSGGFFQWVESVEAPAKAIVKEAAEAGLVIPIGSVFYRNREKDDTSHMRMSFSNASIEKLADAGRRLRSVFQRLLE